MTLTEKVLSEFEQLGLLLLQDPQLTCVASLIVGEAVKGSWWSHSAARDIYAAETVLTDHPDTLVLKLVHGKVTFLHRPLWPALLTVALAGEPWQYQQLPPEATTLLDHINTQGPVTGSPNTKILETRLLAHGQETHTPTGRHTIRLESWLSWAERVNCTPEGSLLQAKDNLEEAVRRIGGDADAFPWNRSQKTEKNALIRLRAHPHQTQTALTSLAV